MNANVARTCANLYHGGNRINSVCCDKSTEEVKCCLPDAIGSTRKQQSKKKDAGGAGFPRLQEGGGGKGGSARSRPQFPPPPLALLPQDASNNEEGGSVASRVSSLNSVSLVFRRFCLVFRRLRRFWCCFLVVCLWPFVVFRRFFFSRLPRLRRQCRRKVVYLPV